MIILTPIAGILCAAFFTLLGILIATIFDKDG